MITAVDSSALIAVAKQEPNAGEWVDVMMRCRSEGELVICELTAAETFAYVQDEADFRTLLLHLGVRFDPVAIQSAILAGRVFTRYRKAGGPRTHLVPDFIVAAHASLQADRLLTSDRGYTRRYFPKLKLLTPS